MTYGSSAGILAILGLAAAETSPSVYNATNIAAAIAFADALVDVMNADADSTHKTMASNMIASRYLQNSSIQQQMRGLTSDGGMNGSPAKMGSLMPLITEEVRLLLMYSFEPCGYSSPDTAGSDYQ